eukprot:gene8342-9243_t
MKDAAARLREISKKEHPENIEHSPNGATVAKVEVSIDGTWQRRGHCSKSGVAFIISIRTVVALDFVVKSKCWHECSSNTNDDKTSDLYKTWKAKHENKCSINHTGSTGSMETSGAIKMLIRFVEKRSLQYTTFIGDGDTDCFASVRDECYKVFQNKYVVTREECVGYVQERLEASLRRYKTGMKGKKLCDGKTVDGRGGVTDKIMEKMQNYFGQAICSNSENKIKMKKAIGRSLYYVTCVDVHNE